MRYGMRAAMTLALCCAASGVGAQSDTAKAFGARERVWGVKLSPDGLHYLALVAMKGVATSVVVGDVATGTIQRVTVSNGAPERLTDCQWANSSRLVCGIAIAKRNGRQLLGFSRLIAIDADGKNIKLLTARTSDDASGPMQNGGRVIDWFGDETGSTILMTRQFVPEHGSGGSAISLRGFGVERVDPVTMRRTTFERPRLEAEEYISDGRGTVRIMGTRPQDVAGYGKNRMIYTFRRKGERDWMPLSIVTGDSQTRSGFDPYAVDPTLDVAYGFDSAGGHVALFCVALDGSGKRELVFARPDTDIDGLIRIGRDRRVVGVSFATDRRETAFFDPVLKKLQDALRKALPNLPLISFVDANADESRLLLWAGSDIDPGRYFVYDKATRHLDLLMSARPELEGRTLAAVKSTSYVAADGTSIPAYLTLPPGHTDAKGLPAIVMPHGGPTARDEWGFDWLAQFFAARGYAVLQPNFRGSSGYGDGWFQNNGFKSWKIAIGDIDDGGRWLIAQGVDPTKLAVVGWSYGGYAALQSSALAPDLFKAIVAIAPVTDLAALREESRDFSNYRLVDGFIGRGDHIRAGSPAQNVAAIRAPVLLFHGTEDQNVGVGQSRLMASRLKDAGKPVEFVEFKGLDHQIDDSEARVAMLDKADRFLRAAMKMAD